MAWYEEAVFYHIYPLGLTGAPEKNDYAPPAGRLNALHPWIDHIRSLGCTALYIGPLFQSVGHGYETTDYRTVDSRLGTNGDLRRFIDACHAAGLRVVLDAVFGHTGRDFFAFRDLLARREASAYRDWYCSVDFGGNNEYGDGLSYANWGGYNLLAKLNLKNPEVASYLLDTVRFWISEFGVDGLRLDAADVLDFGFLRSLRAETRAMREDFWLMGEVIHGDYTRWANDETLHAVTDYALHKALWSAHNDRNYFELAHTVRRNREMGLLPARRYNFLDNHDVERIATRLRCRAHLLPAYVLLFTLPGVPSVYYGSEFAVEGKKERGSDRSLRPRLELDALLRENCACLQIVRALGALRAQEPALRRGEYRELSLTTAQLAFLRGDVLVTVSNAEGPADFDLPLEGAYRGALSGREISSENGRLRLTLEPCGGEVWVPMAEGRPGFAPVEARIESPAAPPEPVLPARAEGKPYEQMSVGELQAEILAKLAANGPVTERMRREVLENTHLGSLQNWVRSFR